MRSAIMGIKRRAVLIGGAAVLGGGLFGIEFADRRARTRAAELTTKGTEASFMTWLKIAEDDTVTLYSPHIDFGQGSHTALAQMLADELDADFAKVVVEAAPADAAFGNTPLIQGFMGEMSGHQALVDSLPSSFLSMMARNRPIQLTGGSSAIRATGQYGMRVVGASARLALLEEAAERLKVSAGELTTNAGRVTHAATGKSLRYGELAAAAARRSLEKRPTLKDRKDYRYIGKPVARLDIPSKVRARRPTASTSPCLSCGWPPSSWPRCRAASSSRSTPLRRWRFAASRRCSRSTRAWWSSARGTGLRSRARARWRPSSPTAGTGR
jgi:isoquinoline 1-oxidoreductase beta subunit